MYYYSCHLWYYYYHRKRAHYIRIFFVLNFNLGFCFLVFFLYVVLDVVRDTLSSMILFFYSSDIIQLSLLLSPKLSISSSEYEFSIRLKCLLIPTYFELVLLFLSLLIWSVLFYICWSLVVQIDLLFFEVEVRFYLPDWYW